MDRGILDGLLRLMGRKPKRRKMALPGWAAAKR